MNAELVLLQARFAEESAAASGQSAAEHGLFATLVIQVPRQIALVLKASATVARKRLPRRSDRPATHIRIGQHQRIIIYITIYK